MNNIEEIKFQTKFNCFGKLYGHLASALLSWMGRHGERLLRKAIQEYGFTKGAALRKEQLQEGIKLNLQSLFRAESCCGEDPRFFRVSKKDAESVQLTEVYACPLDKMWRDMGCRQVGSFYCEEYAHALIAGYTQGKGQANVSNHLTCDRDNRCVFAFYYRMANISAEQQKHFYNGADPHPASDITRDLLLLYSCVYQEALSYQEEGGRCAIAQGLRAFADDVIAGLTLEADHTGEMITAQFLADYCSVPLTVRDLRDLKEDAARIFEINVVEPLRQVFLEKESVSDVQ